MRIIKLKKAMSNKSSLNIHKIGVQSLQSLTFLYHLKPINLVINTQSLIFHVGVRRTTLKVVLGSVL